MAGPVMRSIFSSHIQSIGYDDPAHELHVLYKSGRTAVYEGVPENIAGQVMNSASIGSSLHALVKDRYPFRYIE